MQAVIFKEPGTPQVMQIATVDRPQPEAEEIQIRVHAAGVNRVDCLMRSGKYTHPLSLSPVLGVEVAGTVEEVGANVTRWQPGDTVAALLKGGGYGQWVTTHQALAFTLPQSFTFEEMAAVPEVFLTAFQLLNWVGNLKAKERVLVHAGASGVGTAAIQIANLQDTEVIVTVGSEEKAKYCLSLGAKHAIIRHDEPFDERVAKITDNLGVDLILDCVGQAYWQQNINALRKSGRLVLYGALSGAKVENMNLLELYRKWPTVVGSTLFPRSIEYKDKLVQAMQSFCLPHFTSGKLKPIIHQIIPFQDVSRAHEIMEANQNIGKIILNEF